MQQEQEPSKAALQRSLNSQGIGGSTAMSMPAEPPAPLANTPPCPALIVQVETNAEKLPSK